MGKLINLIMQDCPEMDWLMTNSFEELQRVKFFRSMGKVKEKKESK